MSDRAKNLLRYLVAYPLFFLLSLVVGAYWTFPYDHLKDYIEQEAARGGTMQLAIDSLEPSWVTGVEAEGVTIRSIPEDANETPREIEIREASARISLLSLLGGTVEVDYDATVGAGEVSGTFAQGDEGAHVIAHVERLNVGSLGPLPDPVNLPFTGLLSGDIDLKIAPEAAGTEGEIDLTLRSLSLGDGEARVTADHPLMRAGIPVPTLDLGTLELDIEVERGQGTINELHASGDGAELWITGEVLPRLPFERSGVDVLMRIKFSDEYAHSSGAIEGAFAATEMIPELRPTRTPDGAFQWRVHGSLGASLQMVPAGSADMPEAH